MNSQIGQHEENIQNQIDENEINFKNNEQYMPIIKDNALSLHKQFIEKIEKIDQIKIFVNHIIQNKEKVMLKLLDFLTIIYIGIIFSSLSGLLYLKAKQIKKAGLINYLPPKLKNLILRRSIFDVLMDIWYLPTITEYIKLLISPILYKLSPQEATRVLEDFDPAVRKMFLTKGLINLFPNHVKGVLLPSENVEIILPHEQLIKPMLTSEENQSDSTKEDQNLVSNEKLTEECDQSYSSPEQGLLPYVDKKKLILKENSKFENKLDKHEISSDKQANYHKDVYEKEIPLLSIEQSNPLVSVRKCINIEPDHHRVDQMIELNVSKDEGYRFYEVEDERGKKVYKTIVIESSETLKKKDLLDIESSMKDIKNFCWDNFEAYYKKEAKKAAKAANTQKGNFFNIFSKYFHERLMAKIDYNKLSKACVIFLITFIIQMILSKKARRWSVSFLQFALYMVTSLGAGGTLYFLLIKRAKLGK